MAGTGETAAPCELFDVVGLAAVAVLVAVPLDRDGLLIPADPDHWGFHAGQPGSGRRPGDTEPLDLQWSPDGRWLAINLLAVDEEQHRTEIHIIPIGLPTDPPAEYGLPPIRP